jgi:hypothetical protein
LYKYITDPSSPLEGATQRKKAIVSILQAHPPSGRVLHRKNKQLSETKEKEKLDHQPQRGAQHQDELVDSPSAAR